MFSFPTSIHSQARALHNDDQLTLIYFPFPQIDGEFELFESRAIARYIVAKYGNGKLLPFAVPGDAASIERAAKFEQAASIESANFDPFASAITKEKIFKP